MPPVSSRTTSRSTPSMRSRLSGLASYNAGTGRTGRRFAYRPIPLRSPSRPCSGRGACGSVVSHCGPPTAASVLLEAEVLADRAQQLEGRAHDLRADPVSGQGDDAWHGAAGYVKDPV